MALSLETFSKAVAPIQRRLGQVVNWAVVHLVDTSTPSNGVQLEMVAGEVSDGIFHAEDYGFSGVPLPKALGVVLCIAGEKDSSILMRAHDMRYRPRGMQSGDVCVYSHQDAPLAGEPNDQNPLAARHRIMLTDDRTILMRGDRLDIRIGAQSLVMDEHGVKITATSFEVAKHVPTQAAIDDYLAAIEAAQQQPNPPPRKTKGEKMADLAESTFKSIENTPYKLGGHPPAAYDCSAYIRWLYSGAESVPYSSVTGDAAGISQWAELEEVPGKSLMDAQRGDLLYFPKDNLGPNHIMIALGGGRFAGAQSTASGMRLIDPSVSKDRGYWAWWEEKKTKNIKILRFKNSP